MIAWLLALLQGDYTPNPYFQEDSQLVDLILTMIGA